MHNRRDQVNAHGFMVGRLVSALLRAEPDLAVPPLRRSWGGLIIGALVAALAVTGFAVFALISPGSAAGWRAPGTLILDRGTGTRYVLAGGRLHPVLNYASARLLLGARPAVRTVATKALKDMPRGGPVGIDGAPDSLPDPAGPAAPWLACAGSIGSRPALSLVIGPAEGERPLPPGQAVLVRTPDGTTYLVADGRRLRVTEPWVTRSLGMPDDAAIGVRDAWIDTLPAGPDLPAPATPGLGTPGPALDGSPSRVGEVFAARGTDGSRRFYLLAPGGLRPISQTAASLILGDPATARAYPGGRATARDLGPAALASTRALPAPDWQAGLPAAPPRLDATSGGRMPCVRTVPGGAHVTTSLVTVPGAPVAANAVPTAAAEANPAANRIADQITVAPGAGLLARTLPAPGVPGAGLFLVTEDGTRFPVQDEAAATALGHPISSATAVPADLLALLPTGPVLHALGTGGDAG
ncbi:type VII secretion protein EccB [Actinomadura sp. DC4]|uniref:type VII secretion protein EccB n=1 Tax=Actinomadura sp. DC4 TaxID=3055069 RepID=UPI0025B03597|nr:type VII secretion protein EccB [Actinomadura sp. DC4]MDN3359699.1 type VII secretion protein EccB [Actinomadura sp. DC4]